MTAIPSPKFKLNVKEVNGLPLSPLFQAGISSAVNYKARDDDLFIITYPKSGTTWLQEIVLLLFHDGEGISYEEFNRQSPFLGKTEQNLETLKRPIAIKGHLPFNYMPYNRHAKYIYCLRNPKDNCVSYYYHAKYYKFYDYEGDFHDYILSWLRGEIDFGAYDKHVLSWWSHRDDENVLIIRFEDLKCKTRDSIIKIAKFLGNEYEQRLRTNPEILEKILKKTEFTVMKQRREKPITQLSVDCNLVCESRETDFFRKGIIGDWRNHFTDEENKMFESWFHEKFAGTGVESLWDDFGVFEYRK